MFEVDLLQGAQGTGTRPGQGTAGKRRSRLHARTLRGILLNGWVLGSLLMAFGSLGISIRLALGTSQRIAHLDATLRVALQDSVWAAEQLRTRLRLENRHDSLAARVKLIEEIDARRYDWPHLLEEVAVAVPDGVWITRIGDVTPGWPGIRLRVEGKTLDNLALTRFWNALEASFFMENVELARTEHDEVREPGPDGEAGDAYHFAIEADWENPPHDILDFVPHGETGT